MADDPTDVDEGIKDAIRILKMNMASAVDSYHKIHAVIHEIHNEPVPDDLTPEQGEAYKAIRSEGLAIAATAITDLLAECLTKENKTRVGLSSMILQQILKNKLGPASFDKVIEAAMPDINKALKGSADDWFTAIKNKTPW